MGKTFELTKLDGAPLEGIWKPAKKGSKKFSAARVKSVPAVLHAPPKYDPGVIGPMREMALNSVVVVSEDRRDFVELFDSVEDFEVAGYSFV